MHEHLADKGASEGSRLEMETYRTGPGKNLVRERGPGFEADQDAMKFEKDFIGNSYFLYKEPQGTTAPFDPFKLWEKDCGSNYVQSMAYSSYSNADIDWDLYVKFMQAALCTGFSVLTGLVFDEYRFQGRPRMNQRMPEFKQFLKNIVTVHGRVLTWDVISHYKFHVTRDWVETYYTFCDYYRPGERSLIITFIPHLFDSEFGTFLWRLNHAHSVLVKWAYSNPDESITIGVWDPNFPEDNNRSFKLLKDGAFGYWTSFGSENTFITDGTGTSMHPGGEPAEIGSMMAVAVPVSVFTVQKDFAGYGAVLMS